MIVVNIYHVYAMIIVVNIHKLYKTKIVATSKEILLLLAAVATVGPYFIQCD